MLAPVLIANRGEIVARIARTARRLGIGTIAIASDADRGAPFTAACDRVVAIGGELAADSYLRIDAIVAAARSSGAKSVHPGYGFLSENADFAEAVEAAGLVWIGPPPAAMRAMADKAAARRRMDAAGVPVLPGYDGEAQDAATLRAEAARLGYPLMVKAVAGGGGRGMRLVADEAGLDAALASAAAEAKSAFGDARLLLERAVEHARHVEIQVFADALGHVIHLGERDCSLQRRHQKLVEEAPSPAVTPALRRRMGDAAVAVARAVGYRGAGTVEFLLDARRRLPLHRDEHAPAGRARGDRGAARRRPGRVAAARRRRRGAAADAGRSAGALRGRRPRDRGAALRRGSGAGLPAAIGADRPLAHRAGRPHRPRARRRRRGAARSTTRCSAR